MSNNDLKHYGVIGMKWGIRRASKKGKTYTYKSRTTKKLEKEFNKRPTEKTAKRLINSLDHDSKRQKMAEERTWRETLLGDPIFATAYDSLRASDVERGTAFVLAKYGGPIPAYFAKKAYIRKDDK